MTLMTWREVEMLECRDGCGGGECSNVFVTKCQCGDTITQDVALGVQRGQGNLPYSLTKDLVAVGTQTGHFTRNDILVEETASVVVVGDGFLQNWA